MKIVYFILNALSFIPVFLYPVALASSIMIFDSPGSSERWDLKLFYFAIWLYPIFIILCIIATWKFDSIWPALLAQIPLVYTLSGIAASPMANKKEFNSAEKQYVYNDNTFINLEREDKSGWVYAYQRLGMFKYISKAMIGQLVDNKIIVYYDSSQSGLHPSPKELITSSKNSNGQTLSENFQILSEQQMEEYTFKNSRQDYFISLNSYLQISQDKFQKDGFYASITLHEKKEDGSYVSKLLGTIVNGVTHLPKDRFYQLDTSFRHTATEYLELAKNLEGKKLIDIYPLDAP